MSSVVQFRAKDQSEDTADHILLTAVMDACTEGLAIIDGGRVLRANHAFARTFGYEESLEVEGTALIEFIPESLFLFARDAESATQSYVSECVGVRRDGAEIRILAASAVLHSSRRELQVINLREITDGRPQQSEILSLQKLESRKLESQRLETLGRVVGGVAHDFNNLLTGILLYCDLLIRGLDPASPLCAYVEEIRKAAGHSSALIRQLLSAAQPQTEDSNAHSWSEVFGGMQNLLRRLLGENIELVTELDPQIPAVGLSSSAMRQVALNLLLNARDAMPDGGRITVTTRIDCTEAGSDLRDGYVEFIVTDNGRGMDAATRARACEAFFTTKTGGHGNGLGLATVHRIVSEANGSLAVESEPNRGTRVCIRLLQVRLPQVRLPQVTLPPAVPQTVPPSQDLQDSKTQIRA